MKQVNASGSYKSEILSWKCRLISTKTPHTNMMVVEARGLEGIQSAFQAASRRVCGCGSLWWSKVANSADPWISSCHREDRDKRKVVRAEIVGSDLAKEVYPHDGVCVMKNEILHTNGVSRNIKMRSLSEAGSSGGIKKKRISGFCFAFEKCRNHSKLDILQRQYIPVTLSWFM